MFKKFCPSCGDITWHNEMKSLGSGRCTYCGYPISSNVPTKREYQEALRKKQCIKKGRLV